jgi:transposase
VDTVDQSDSSDTLDLPSSLRRYRTIEEKRRIVEASLASGTSVAAVARKYEVNANQVFHWRRLYQQGLLEIRDAGVALAMLPVRVEDQEVRSSRRRLKKSAAPARRARTEGAIEIRFSNGQRLRIQGEVDVAALAQIITLLSSR